MVAKTVTIGMALEDIWKAEDIFMDSTEAEKERNVGFLLVPDLVSGACTSS